MNYQRPPHGVKPKFALVIIWEISVDEMQTLPLLGGETWLFVSSLQPEWNKNVALNFATNSLPYFWKAKTCQLQLWFWSKTKLYRKYKKYPVIT